MAKARMARLKTLLPRPNKPRYAEARATAAVVYGYDSLWRPPSKLPLSEWADKYRVLSSESSAEPGQWITAKAPYEKAIMDAISDPDCPRVCVQKASQVGITDSAILNPIGYYIDEDPCPILVVQPTIEMAEAFSTDRLAPMLRDSSRLHSKVADPRARDSQNTLRRKSFKGGFVALGGANSAASLSGRPVRVALFDDVDRYPASAGTEGNPLMLGIARTSAFWNRKVVIVSSPGIKGVSHIEREMAQSTCEFWYLPCPECGVMQILDWDRIRFSDMTHRCITCGEHREKYLWLAGEGEWRAHHPIDKRGNKITTRGFYLSGLYNPWIEWELLVTEFVRAVRANEEGDIEPLKAFRNTRLGMLHEDTGQKVDVDLYHVRREVYKAEVPDGVIVLTAGVDVGERQLNYEVVGWGRGRESWGIEYGLIDGDPREQDVWDLLDDALYHRLFTTSDDKTMRVRKIAVDAGYAPDFVYAYTKPRQPRCIAIKGEGGLGKPFVKGIGKLSKLNRAHVVTLGVDSGKEEVTNRLLVAQIGPGYCHFPCSKKRIRELDGSMAQAPCRGYDQEYFKGLTAENRIVKSKNGFRTYIWIKRLSQRNEPFDCRNYALGALAMPLTGIKLEEMKRDLYSRPKEGDEPESQVPFGAQQRRMFDAEQPVEQQPAGGKATFGAVNRPLQ
jgi:phage terminase large subunit GpA-like protein